MWEEDCHDPFAQAQVYLTTMFTHDLILSPSFTEPTFCSQVNVSPNFVRKWRKSWRAQDNSSRWVILPPRTSFLQLFLSLWSVTVVRQWTVKGLVCDQERMSLFCLGATKMGRLLAWCNQTLSTFRWQWLTWAELKCWIMKCKYIFRLIKWKMKMISYALLSRYSPHTCCNI